MLVEICGDYFNVNDIRHIWIESDSTIVIETISGEEYFLDCTPCISADKSIHQYLKQIINGINIMTGNLTVNTGSNRDWQYWKE